MAPCYLLKLPREIRNMIYDNLHDEYQEHKLPRGKLLVNYKGHAKWSHASCKINTGVSFRADFPMNILKHVSDCEIWLSWFHIKDITSRTDLLLWGTALLLSTGSSFGSQEHMPWTPTTRLVAYVRRELLAQQLRPVLSPATKFKLRVGMDGLPDPEDLSQIGLVRFRRWRSAAARMHGSPFDAKGFFSAFQAPPGENGEPIEVSFLLETAAYCTRKDRERVDEQNSTIAAGNGGDLDLNRVPVQVGLELDRPILVWSMRPAEEGEANYRGFAPELMIEDSR
ncbi:hypothetical protein LTR37_006269 [Vermiconidia calcicola]|uniref:Uncharacterized protein n=1 Tax=Vermiconidia calcicola TaxID=1690605 RepID=A0ACC3NGI2_9PEZI|nr:hypothetical protein LTR37_006269 [Vermiconidia calcicola]